MNRDDPIALLRALDPLDEKELDAVVARLAETGCFDRIVLAAKGRRRSRLRPRLALASVGAVAAILILLALVSDPLAHDGAITSAQAQAQAADALDLQGNWHVTRVTQSGPAKGSAAPRFAPAEVDDTWHAADGRLLVTTTTLGSDGSVAARSTVLYADSERRVYEQQLNRLTIHRFVVPADMRDDERGYLPQSAAELYRAAYRVGKVHLAGVETLHGRRVYRLAFDWLGSTYTLIFDAQRRVPISSESRVREGGDRTYVTRVRYTAYDRVQPGEALEHHLELPPIPSTAKRVTAAAIVVRRPLQGASAEQLARSVAALYPRSFPSTAALDRATYSLVRGLPGGGVAALARVPERGPRTVTCYVLAEIAHRGGEARVDGAGCFSGRGGAFSSLSGTGKAMILGGTATGPGVTFKFSNGKSIRTVVRGGFFLAALPIGLFQYSYGIVNRNADGTYRYESGFPEQGGAFPGWLTR